MRKVVGASHANCSLSAQHRKVGGGALPVAQARLQPAAPPVYRPQPVPKVLQTKRASASTPRPVSAAQGATATLRPGCTQVVQKAEPQARKRETPMPGAPPFKPHIPPRPLAPRAGVVQRILFDWMMPDAPPEVVERHQNYREHWDEATQRVLNAIPDSFMPWDTKLKIVDWIRKMRALNIGAMNQYANFLRKLTTFFNKDEFADIINIFAKGIPYYDKIKRFKKSGTEVGLATWFAKIKNQNHKDGFRGLIAELDDALNTLIHIGPDTLTFGTEKRYVGKQLPGQVIKVGVTDKPASQEVDTTFTKGGVKYYVETKADAHTAAEKHAPGKTYKSTPVYLKENNNQPSIYEKQKTSQQLLSYKAATLAHATKTTVLRDIRVLISIPNSRGWLELFTSGAAGAYIQFGFYLRLGIEWLEPDRIQKIQQAVDVKARKLFADEHGEEPKTYVGMKNARKRFFEVHRNTWNTPSDFERSLL